MPAREFVRRLCEEAEKARRFPISDDDALENGRASAVQELWQFAQETSVDGVTRHVSPAVTSLLASWLEDAPDDRCTELAVIEILKIWPEAEPGSLLKSLARSASVEISLRAVEAMAETGRLDYLDTLETLTDPGNDDAVIWRAVVAAARISGEPTALERVTAHGYPLSADLASHLSRVGRAVDAAGLQDLAGDLILSDDKTRVTLGATILDLDSRIPLERAAAAKSLTAADDLVAAAALVRACRDRALPGLSPSEVAGNRGISPTARTAAYLLAEPPLRSPALCLEILRESTDAEAALRLMERAFAEGGPAGLRFLLDSYTPGPGFASAIEMRSDALADGMFRSALDEWELEQPRNGGPE